MSCGTERTETTEKGCAGGMPPPPPPPPPLLLVMTLIVPDDVDVVVGDDVGGGDGGGSRTFIPVGEFDRDAVPLLPLQPPPLVVVEAIE